MSTVNSNINKNNKKQRLELTWIGKEEQIKLEPRILIEDPEKSYGDKNTENMLIHGDNLLALKALEQDFAGKIKCIYIDPPYNTGSAFEHYDDNLEHSIWLNLMHQRLVLLEKLLSNDGVVLVQIDKNEGAYLKVLMDEVFGRGSYVTTICVRMSGTSGFKIEHSDKTIVKNAEYIHVYSRNLSLKPAYENARYDPHYSYILKNTNVSGTFIAEKLLDQDLVLGEIKKFELPINTNSLQKLYEISDIFKNYVYQNKDLIGRTHTAPAEALNNKESIMDKIETVDHVIEYITNSGSKYYLKKTDNTVNQYIPINLKFNYVDTYEGYNERLSNILGDWWDDYYLDMGNVAKEGDVYFKASKKPERLLFRIFNMFTKEGDLILDSFLGSGTTAAVAHKMKRKWIGIELGEHATTHCTPRLTNIIDNNDDSGISKFVDWTGGGGFKFFYLAPSLLKKDKFGNWVIDEKYNPNMLAAAMCKHEGFNYSPHEETYWKQGKSTENDYIFVTTNYLTPKQLDSIHEEMKTSESLLICAKTFAQECENKYSNITIKKIPQAILGSCEFGTDNYDLNIIEMTGDIAEEQEEELTNE